MNEIIVAAPSQLDRHADSERDRLMAEYGRLYGRRCWIFERKARLEYELRAIQSFVAGAVGNGGSLLSAPGVEAPTAVVLAGLP